MDIKEILRELAAKKWGVAVETVSDTDLACEFVQELKNIEESDYDEHRWYTTYWQVAQVGDIFIGYQTYSNSGDENAFDGEEHAKMILECLVQLYPKEVTVTQYVTKDKL